MGWRRALLDLGVIQVDLALALQHQRGRGAVPVRIGAHRQVHLFDHQGAHGHGLHVQRGQVPVECSCGVAFETQ
jgi:hypothetical protein